MIETALEAYLKTYRDLIVTERVENSLVISFPFHLAANHRIEITVTDVGSDLFMISDGGRTINEIEAAGQSITEQTKDKIERLASVSGLRIVDGYLILDSTRAELGLSIQRFLEVSKMVGDIYLVHKQREENEEELVDEVQTTLKAEGIHFRKRGKIAGEIEDHRFDLVVPTNGRDGMAVKILSGHNTHGVAQIWGFKCDDIRRGKKASDRTRVALIYDVRNHKWSEASRHILETRADITLPSSSIMELPERFKN